MRKITATARVIDIFSTESLESCAILLDVAESILKQRQARNTPKSKRPEVSSRDTKTAHSGDL